MVHLMIKFAKYQIYFYILPTFSETFIGIKQVWSELQPPRPLEVKFKIYTPIDHGFTWSDSCDYESWLWKQWLMKICSCPKDIFKFDICNFSKSMSLFDSNLWGLKIPFVNTHSYESKTMIVCKFWTFPPTPFEAVAETILAWSQWNFLKIWLRYKSQFDI